MPLSDCRDATIQKKIQAGTPGKITDIREGERLDGGVLGSLLVDGENLSVKIVTEYAIRQVLGDTSLTLTLADGSTRTCGSLLPSAFCSLTADIDTPGSGKITITGARTGPTGWPRRERITGRSWNFSIRILLLLARTYKIRYVKQDLQRNGRRR